MFKNEEGLCVKIKNLVVKISALVFAFILVISNVSISAQAADA